MANPNTVSLQLVAAISNGIALAQQPAGAGALTLNGSLVTAGVATMDVARRVLISSTSASDGGVIFTITGTDAFGNTISEKITGVVAGTPVASVRDYKTITGVSSGAASVGNITVGTNGVASTPWIVVDPFRRRVWALGGGITGPAGTTYTLEHTFDDPNSIAGQGSLAAGNWSMAPGGFVPAHVWTYAGITAASGDNLFTYTSMPIFAFRLTINSGTGLVTIQSLQAGID